MQLLHRHNGLTHFRRRHKCNLLDKRRSDYYRNLKVKNVIKLLKVNLSNKESVNVSYGVKTL